jgi:hypothetical protein
MRGLGAAPAADSRFTVAFCTASARIGPVERVAADLNECFAWSAPSVESVLTSNRGEEI